MNLVANSGQWTKLMVLLAQVVRLYCSVYSCTSVQVGGVAGTYNWHVSSELMHERYCASYTFHQASGLMYE